MTLKMTCSALNYLGVSRGENSRTQILSPEDGVRRKLAQSPRREQTEELMGLVCLGLAKAECKSPVVSKPHQGEEAPWH